MESILSPCSGWRPCGLTRMCCRRGIPAVAATVVPEVKCRPGAERIRFIDARNCGNFVDFTQVDTSTLGADRVANAIALAEFQNFRRSRWIAGRRSRWRSSMQSGCSAGGAIAPGGGGSCAERLRREPHSFRRSRFRPNCRSGPGTARSNRSGSGSTAVRSGSCANLWRLRRNRMAASVRMRVIATGGDAPFFAAALPFLELARKSSPITGFVLPAGFFRFTVRLRCVRSARGRRRSRCGGR